MKPALLHHTLTHTHTHCPMVSVGCDDFVQEILILNVSSGG